MTDRLKSSSLSKTEEIHASASELATGDQHLYNLLREYGRHKKGCTVETTGCICGFSDKISRLVPPSAVPVSQRRTPESWWCCNADYPNHEASCVNAPKSADASALAREQQNLDSDHLVDEQKTDQV